MNELKLITAAHAIHADCEQIRVMKAKGEKKLVAYNGSLICDLRMARDLINRIAFEFGVEGLLDDGRTA